MNTYKFPKEQVEEIRHGTIANIKHHLNKKNKHMNVIDKLFLRNSKETKKYLKEHDDVFFTNSDKENMTVALYNTYYMKEMEDLVNDQTTYLKLDKNTLEELRKNTQEFLTIWNINGFQEKEYHRFSLT